MIEAKQFFRHSLAKAVGTVTKALHYAESAHGDVRLSLRLPAESGPYLSLMHDDSIPSQSTRAEKTKAKVFGIGLSRTGTTSLSRALSLLGYENSFHWTRDGKILGWSEFFQADAATDVPCSVQFESLYNTFENAKFVYTVREVDAWRSSIQKHLQAKSPSDLREKHLRLIFKAYKSAKKFNCGSRWEMYNLIRQIQIREELYVRHGCWTPAYKAFERRVRHFFGDKPDGKLLEINIARGDGWNVLCPFLGVDIPNVPFPHANQSH